MIGTVVRIAIFILLVAAGILGVNRLLETPGGIVITFAGVEYYFTPLAFVALLLLAFLALWAVFKLAGLIVALARFIAGDETAIGRYFDRSREQRGLDALARGIVALSAGDARTARAKAEKAEKLLQRPELTRLLNAQAAELAGDTTRAKIYYTALADDPDTAFIGLRGLLDQALAAGDTDKALKLAAKAAEIRPRDGKILETLYELQSRKFDWAGARKTLAAQARAGLIDRAEANRREARLAMAQATEAEQAGRIEDQRRLTIEAVRLDATNPDAVFAAARQLTESGQKRQATKLVIEAWRQQPHPKIGAAFAAIEPDESPAMRKRRFEKLFEAYGTHPEARFLQAELAIMAGNWTDARAALTKLEETEPSARSCAIYAAIARGEGRPEAEVRAWLARALGAPRQPTDDAGILGHAAMLPLLGDEPDGKTGTETAA